MKTFAVGAVGQIPGRFHAAAGRECATPFHDRVMSLPLEKLRRVPRSIAVVSGSDRGPALVNDGVRAEAAAVGEIPGRFHAAAGRECATPFRDRVMRLPLEKLRRVPRSIAVVPGSDRGPALVNDGVGAEAAAVGEIPGRFHAAAGRECATPFHDRVMSLPLEKLRRVPRSIAVVSGSDRGPALVNDGVRAEAAAVGEIHGCFHAAAGRECTTPFRDRVMGLPPVKTLVNNSVGAEALLGKPK